MSTRGIDWEDMRTGYNRMYGTKYKDIMTFIRNGCRQHGIQEFAEKLGVCGPTVDRIRKKLELNKSQLVWKRKREKILELAREGKTKNMTILEIAEHAGYVTLNTAYRMAKEEEFEFKRRWQRKST